MSTLASSSTSAVADVSALVPTGLPSCALVDLDAIRDNTALMRERAGGAAVMAIVKADAYGHGMVPAARAALVGGASLLGVAHLGEALELRAAGVDVPVLAWLTVPGDRFVEAVAARVDVAVSAPWSLTEVAAAARSTGMTARVHLKVDTGLSRNGCRPADLPALIAEARRLEADDVVRVVGLMSHLACSDVPGHPSIASQLAVFTEADAELARAGIRLELRHLSNSAAVLTVPQARFDAVRPGLALYGLSPMPETATSADIGLRPVMTVVGRIAMVKHVGAGQGISYGLTYTTDAPTTLALLPLGYGDGLPRHASGRGPVLVGGRTVTVSGRVCMDQVVLDLGGRTDAVRVGDLAVVVGPGGDGGPTAQDWAEAAGTISYEIVTRVGSRVPRIHVGTAGTTA